MSAFENNPWIKMDKKQTNKFENNPWVQKDKELAGGGKTDDGKNLKNPRKAPEKVEKSEPQDDQPSGWKEPPPKKIGQNPFEKGQADTKPKVAEEPQKPEKKLVVTNPFGSDSQAKKKEEELSGWKEPPKKKIGANPFGQKSEDPQQPVKDLQKNPRKAPANPFGSSQDQKDKDPVVSIL